tara:strand:+ start:69 stop:452 length:384 start_codon:yes stop_codon:yes gene_type:complete
MKNLNIGTRKIESGHFKVIVFNNDLHELVGYFKTNDMQLIDDISSMHDFCKESELLMFDSFQELKYFCFKEVIKVGQKYIVLSDIQNVFKEGEIVTLKEVCEDGVHLFELGNREVYMSDFEVKQILN